MTSRFALVLAGASGQTHSKGCYVEMVERTMSQHI
jgi:hypothetical protein